VTKLKETFDTFIVEPTACFMKKIIVLSLLYSLGTTICSAQALDLLQKKGDSLYRIKDFKTAAITFGAAARVAPANNSGVIFRNRLSASRCWALAQLPDSAFAELNRITTINNLVYNNLMTLTTDQDLLSLHQDPRWTASIKIYLKL
jgi:hypothetical protein